jgi:predicted RNA-binding protein with PIN domain
MHYIIDGYNVIRTVDWLAVGPLRDQRDRLLRYIEEKRPQGSASHRVTVVFDGQPDVTSPPWPGPTQVRFSPGPDADKIIKDLVDGSGNPRDTVVVTDDKAIRRWVRGTGARVLSCTDFIAAAAAPLPPRRAETLDPADADAINEEMKDLWKLE